ncbi:hypothetical protein B296_00013399 [Ensete ventricosum]|uniref:Uncharacterized protein n=1 Tax=Ensete ventricosum TaxID=4639 RepID=A0A427ARK6_ENSVE|nr:hypothetical protein B296_00013399 [Ensete ventricosum]
MRGGSSTFKSVMCGPGEVGATGHGDNAVSTTATAIAAAATRCAISTVLHSLSPTQAATARSTMVRTKTLESK